MGTDLPFHDLTGGKAFPTGFDPRAIAKRSKRRRRAVRAGAVTLSALVVAAFAGFANPQFHADFASDTGEIKTVILPDGTIAELDSGTALSWSETGGEKHVTLHQGTALFTTASGSSGSFTVATSDLEARPIGTVFAVTVEAADWRSLVVSGEVEVTTERDREGERLGAGQAATVSAVNGQIQRASVPLDLALSWREGTLDFRNARLSEVISTLDRYRPGRMVLLNEAAGQKRFDGVLRIDRIEAALGIVARSGNLQVTDNIPYLTILR